MKSAEVAMKIFEFVGILLLDPSTIGTAMKGLKGI